MHRFSLAALIVIPSVLLAPLAAAASPKDEADIKALESAFAKAVLAKDVDAVMKFYAPDIFVFDLVPPRQYVGAAAYRKDWQALFAGFKGPLKFAVKDLAVSADGTIGYSHSIQDLAGEDPKGHKIETVVRTTDVYRKIGGAWLIVQEHVSVPVDLETGKADLMSKP